MVLVFTRLGWFIAVPAISHTKGLSIYGIRRRQTIQRHSAQLQIFRQVLHNLSCEGKSIETPVFERVHQHAYVVHSSWTAVFQALSIMPLMIR